MEPLPLCFRLNLQNLPLYWIFRKLSREIYSFEGRMVMKNNRLLILLGGIVFIISAFLLLNFRFAISSTYANNSVVTMGSGDLIDSHWKNEKINVLLVGEGAQARALRQALSEKREKAGIGEVEFVQDLDTVYHNPVLVVKAGKQDGIWTPFFAQSQSSFLAGYASNGDSSFIEVNLASMEKANATIGSPSPSNFNIFAEYEINDRSFGLISRLGYHQYLADYFAQEIITALKDL
jgi:hypothetical protein